MVLGTRENQSINLLSDDVKGLEISGQHFHFPSLFHLSAFYVKAMDSTCLSNNERIITLSLIRKRSEHNESLVSNLEELALHQEELHGIGPHLGRLCGKTLKILLLQNNVIGEIKSTDMKYFKVLQYLNLALNNITAVRGLEYCEYLNKLDLTLNFIDLDRLEESIDCLTSCSNLKELFLMGNPCSYCSNGNENTVNEARGWINYRSYVVARLTQLQSLDGCEILNSERIKSVQILHQLKTELKKLSEDCKNRKFTKIFNSQNITGEDETTRHCPEDRIRISDEGARKKAEKEAKEKSNHPNFKGEEDLLLEQQRAISNARLREETGDFKQCNEGKWEFIFDEENKPGFLTLNIKIQRHLSSSLIDVDIHPNYISVVIKSKVIRLILPSEINSETSIAQRSTTTGHLLITMPKCNPDEMILSQKSIKHKKTNVKNDVGRKGLQLLLMQEANELSNSTTVSKDSVDKCPCLSGTNILTGAEQNISKIIQPVMSDWFDNAVPPPLL